MERIHARDKQYQLLQATLGQVRRNAGNLFHAQGTFLKMLKNKTYGNDRDGMFFASMAIKTPSQP
jgi:hypothetical protein